MRKIYVLSFTNREREHATALHPFLYLQQTAGNQAVGHTLQAKLKINEPGDEYEREADAVAESVMHMPEPLPPDASDNSVAPLHSPEYIQRKCAACESDNGLCPKCAEEEKQMMQRKPLTTRITPLMQRLLMRSDKEDEDELLQTKEASSGTQAVSPSIENQINGLRGKGQPLAAPTRAFFEPRFGQDFSQVRVHTNSRAAELARAVNARAFTSGQDVVFGKGQYTPETTTGKRLLAHELAHVRQQGDVGMICRKPEPEKTEMYTVKRGDTLSAIAKKHKTTADKLGASSILRKTLNSKQRA